MKKEDQYLERWAKENAIRSTTHVQIAGLEFLVNKNVFSPDPKFTYSTLHLINNLPNCTGKNVLDLGTGAGVVAIVAARRGASRVLAVDIDPTAVENAKINVSKYNLDNIVALTKSDLFENVNGKFDIIVANLPFWKSAWPNQTESMRMLYGRFFGGVKSHLKQNGKVLFAYASFGNMEVVEDGMCLSGLKYKVIKKKKFDVEWYVFESF